MRRGAAVLLGVIALALPIGGAAQTALLLEGTVVEAGTASGIQNAVVSIQGVGAMLTSAEGAFRFSKVRSGTYAVRITALGYTTANRILTIRANTSITIGLEVAPLALDPLRFRSIELEGAVRDEIRDIGVVDAEVSTDGHREAETNSHGRFTVRALDDVPVEIRIRAFGYLPLDSVVRAREDVTQTFSLAPDSLIERMIGVQVKRLEARSRGQRAIVFRQLNRESLLRYAGSHTLRDVLESEYGTRLRGRIGCVMLDEVQLHPDVDGITLATMIPEEVERIEILYSGNMLRIYTRRFMQEIIARQTKLSPPSYFRPPGKAPPLCT